MEKSLFFRAPWSRPLTIVTVAICVLLVAIASGFFVVGMQRRDYLGFLWAMLVLAMLGTTALFRVRGYYLEGDRLCIQRLGWQKVLPLTALESAVCDPLAMECSIRLFGNGGLFAFSGIFWHRKLGRYTAYATAPRLAVVLKFIHKTVVITPEKPDAFIAQLMALKFPQQNAGD
jgi:hypothetical protein